MPDLDVRVIAVFCCAHNSAARLNQVPQNLLNIRIFSNIILTEELEPAAGFGGQVAGNMSNRYV